MVKLLWKWQDHNEAVVKVLQETEQNTIGVINLWDTVMLSSGGTD